MTAAAKASDDITISIIVIPFQNMDLKLQSAGTYTF
jgi:hypothetical protein